MADKLFNPTIHTDDGLVVKNVARAEAIDTSLEMRVQPVLYSWECSRILRRDFSIMTTKMYMALSSRKDWRKEQIQSLLYDLKLASENFVVTCKPYKATRPVPDEELRRLPSMRILSREAMILYKCFTAVDEGMMRLSCAMVDGKMNREQRRDIFRKFEVHYSDLKTLIMHNRENSKTSEQLASELRLE